MQSSDINLGGGSALAIVDDLLKKTVSPLARENAVHIMLVRTIGGSDNPTFDPYGYSMGLPGPYAFLALGTRRLRHCDTRDAASGALFVANCA